ncbi:uncharacterized protein CELE_T21C12.4 [Caenorhabditis elegans]|uniref:Uncharacterized protein n=1 Tax=Caenorhabditis elegans TaxID=6239 RepID=Q22635_CAEEL|nr:Uncharacterized protein CELE_T21C12.4 [Caenorhabditis elegans]CAA90317.4 Uncharacterized protein CELE_T21C12.4 [Caenorhabditis elegans]|eukprot:NP_499326.3 Uncharacterized protein CELE_T21C12.4 [Caenorhabditis elegans]
MSHTSNFTRNFHCRSSSNKRSESEKSPSFSKKRRRARALDPDEFIPPVEGPDVQKIDSETSRKCHSIKGFNVNKDGSVRRLEDNSKYEHNKSSRQKRSEAAPLENSEGKSTKSRKLSSPSKKSNKKSISKKSDRSKVSKVKRSPKTDKELEKKPSSIYERKDVDGHDDLKGSKHEKPKTLRKFKKPWKSLFKVKRQKPRIDIHVKERSGMWA